MIVPLTVADFISRGERVYGERVGLIDEPIQPALSQGDITYAQMGKLARRQACRLDELEVGVGDRVAVVSHNSSRLLTSFFGVSGYGRVLVPINFRLAADEVQYIISHSGARVLYVDPELESRLTGVDCEHKFILGDDQSLYSSPDATPIQWESDENATATINYTSGTTSRPKGVEITHRNLWTNAVTFALHAGMTDRDVYLHTLPMFHANGWGQPFAATGLGITQVVLRQIDGTEILRRVQQHGVTYMCAAPAVVASVLDAAQAWEGPIPGAGTVRVIVAGAPPPTRIVARVEQQLGWEFIQIYGLTETSPLLSINRSRHEWDGLVAEERAAKLVRAGAPALGVSLAVTPDDEVIARSNVVSAGYWNSPEETAKAFANNWFHTGDVGKIGPDGYLTLGDRKKDIIITGGENVSSVEVEDVLLSHPAVAEVAVIGVPSPKWGETIKAVVVVADGAAVTEDELIAWCKQRAARYKSPTSIDFRSSLERTATGKLQKFKLRNQYLPARNR